MIIGIDGNEANVEKRVGISEYSFELLTQFKKYQVSSIKYQVYLKTNPLSHMPEEAENWRYRIVWPRKLWTQIGLPFDLYTHKPMPDVFFSPTHYAPRFSPIPTVISVMDISYIHFSEMFKKIDLLQLRNWTAYSVKHAERIFTISKSSKSDIIKQYNISEDKVVVTYPGIKLSPRGEAGKTQMSKLKTTTQNSKLSEKYGIKGEYILFVGTLQPRKNIVRLIEAFSLLCHPELVSGSRDSSQVRLGQNDIQLIIIGKKGWMYEDILQAPKKYNVESRVKFLEFVTDEDLSVFYKNALCFVLPSLYEGFGLPVLEAMQQGCPVITSNVSSLPEAGGDAVMYVDPENVNDIAEKIEEVIKNESMRKQMIQKGYQQVQKFSWEKTAEETLKVLQEVAGNKV